MLLSLLSKKWTLFTLFFLIGSVSLQADCEVEGGLRTGLRRDQLDWSISGLEGNPNVLSELTWKDVDSWVLGYQGEIKTCRNLVFGVDAQFGVPAAGQQIDSDYGGNDRTQEFCRSYCDVGGGVIADASLMLGLRFFLPLENFEKLTASYGFFGGVSSFYQKFEQTQGVQTIPFEIRIPGLDSHYEALWSGSWIGGEFKLNNINGFDFVMDVRYHPSVRYAGKGHWNLRPEFWDDFRDSAEGNGIDGGLGVVYTLPSSLKVGLVYKYRKFTTGRGQNRKFISVDLSEIIGEKAVLPAVFDLEFNGANWSSSSLLATLSYDF